jgi:mRNA-degrading endonuclease RelE of RelBE toxin-antitoxin system
MKKKFELVFAREFLKRIRNLDKDDQIRVLRNLKILEEHPFAGKRLSGRLREVMSFRVGEYRVIYQVSEKTIIIRTIGQREQVYKK